MLIFQRAHTVGLLISSKHARLAVCLQLLVPDVTLLREDVTGLKKTPPPPLPRPAKPYTSRLISKLCSTPVASHCEQNKRRRRAAVRVRSRWSSSAVSCPLWVALSSSVVVIACSPTKSPRASIKKEKKKKPPLSSPPPSTPCLLALPWLKGRKAAASHLAASAAAASQMGSSNTCLPCSKKRRRGLMCVCVCVSSLSLSGLLWSDSWNCQQQKLKHSNSWWCFSQFGNGCG